MNKREAKLLSRSLVNYLKKCGYTGSVYHAAADHMYIVANHSDFTVYEYNYMENDNG